MRGLEALAADVAEWMDDGTNQDRDATLADAYALLETLRRKGWRWSFIIDPSASKIERGEPSPFAQRRPSDG